MFRYAEVSASSWAPRTLLFVVASSSSCSRRQPASLLEAANTNTFSSQRTPSSVRTRCPMPTPFDLHRPQPEAVSAVCSIWSNKIIQLLDEIGASSPRLRAARVFAAPQPRGHRAQANSPPELPQAAGSQKYSRRSVMTGPPRPFQPTLVKFCTAGREIRLREVAGATSAPERPAR